MTGTLGVAGYTISKQVDIVFDGPPGPEAGRFVEVEDSITGRGLSVGEWVERPDGFWALRVTMVVDA